MPICLYRSLLSVSLYLSSCVTDPRTSKRFFNIADSVTLLVGLSGWVIPADARQPGGLSVAAPRPSHFPIVPKYFLLWVLSVSSHPFLGFLICVSSSLLFSLLRFGLAIRSHQLVLQGYLFSFQFALPVTQTMHLFLPLAPSVFLGLCASFVCVCVCVCMYYQ